MKPLFCRRALAVLALSVATSTAIPVQAQEKTPSLGIGREAIIEALNNGDTGFRFDPATVEARLYAQWESSGVFHEEADPARPPFVISMPPPNITGRAHIGHASTYTPMDVLTRYHRMLGNNAVWIPGQDHAAIATEAVIVRELASEGTSRDALGREPVG